MNRLRALPRAASRLRRRAMEAPHQPATAATTALTWRPMATTRVTGSGYWKVGPNAQQRAAVGRSQGHASGRSGFGIGQVVRRPRGGAARERTRGFAWKPRQLAKSLL